MDTTTKPRPFDRRKPGFDRRDPVDEEPYFFEERRDPKNDRRELVLERRHKMLGELTGSSSGAAIEARCFGSYQRHLLDTGIPDPEASLKVVQNFSIYLHNISKHLLDVSEKDLENYLRLINNRHQSEPLTKKNAAVLIDFYLLLIQEGVLVTNPLIHLYKLLADASFFDETKGLELDKFTSALSSAPKTEESEKSKTAPSVYQPRVAGRQSQTARPLPPYSGRGADDGTKKRFFSRGLMLSVGTIMVAGLLIGSYPVWKKTLAEWITLQTTSQSDRGEKRDLDGDGVILSPESKTKIHSVQRGKKIDRITYFYQNGLADYYCRVFLNTLCNQGSLNLNPLKSDSKAMEDGNMLFSRHCVRCHGIKGRGMGMEAAQLETPPTSLAFVAERVLERDAYMFWSIAEGGTPFKSAMPPYKDVLSTKEIWSIIVYLGML